jgi:hypothetical protein
MPNLDLTKDEAAALVALLTRTITDDRYPLPPPIHTLKAILANLRPEPAAIHCRRRRCMLVREQRLPKSAALTASVVPCLE